MVLPTRDGAPDARDPPVWGMKTSRSPQPGVATGVALLCAWLLARLAVRVGGCWRERWFVGAGATGHDVDVSAGCGAREQEALQRGGTQDAAVEVGEDGGEVGGAEASRDGGECGGGGAAVDGGEEMATVAEQDADGVE